MSPSSVAVHETFPFVLPNVSGVSRANGRIGPSRHGRWRRLTFWPAEFLRLVGVVYLFPVVVLAIGIPFALALNGLILAGQWLWRSLG